MFFSYSLMLFLFFSWLLHILLVLLSVAFFTLFERKVIGLFHIRVGPNKVSFLGLIQPLLDALKLLTKQSITPQHSNKLIYNLSPLIALIISIMLWVLLFSFYSFSSGCFSFLFFFCLSSFIVFSVLMSGWSSNSKYSLIGRLRSVAQSISYESVFRTLLVLFRFFICSYRIKSFINISRVYFLFILPVWIICSLAEAHRAPFDFREAESELVSGFNTEYSGAYFAFFFLREYSVLLFSRILIVYIFFSFCLFFGFLQVVFITLVVSFLFTWIRITFCRYRYDKLISLSWKVLLPLSLSLLLVYLYTIICFI